jgi:hypothetical protein
MNGVSVGNFHTQKIRVFNVKPPRVYSIYSDQTIAEASAVVVSIKSVLNDQKMLSLQIGQFGFDFDFFANCEYLDLV